MSTADQPKATEVLDPALEKIKWGLEETMRARDAEIRELKARNEYLQKALDALADIHYGIGMYDGVIEASHFDGVWKHETVECPELTRYLCERNGWPNPLEKTNE